MNVFLKIKIKTLATEAKDIRNQEKKVSTNARHRKRLARALELGSTYDGFYPSMPNRIGRIPTSEAQSLRIEKRLARARAQLNNPQSNALFLDLREHRTGVVRREARASYIAYGFLRGLTYQQVENNAKKLVEWDAVERIVKKFGEEDTRVLLQRFAEWREAAQPSEEQN